MGIVIRAVDSDADLERWRQVRAVVLPEERVLSVAEMRAITTPETVHLLAEVDGQLAGSGLGGRSSFGYAGVHPRVLPAFRRRGVGSTLLRELERHALGLGFAEVGTNVDDPGSLAFAQQFGLVEVDRQIEQVRQIGHEPSPDLPAGVSLASVAERPELWAPAFDGLAVEAYGDMATDRPITISRQEWQQEAMAWPEAMFLALDRDEVIGCAGLARDADAPERAEHALTAVRRSWRRRGIATLLKRRCLAFAAANGIAEVYTWTQRDNAAMIVLNQRLGYRRRGESVTVRGPLPLQATAGPVSG